MVALVGLSLFSCLIAILGLIFPPIGTTEDVDFVVGLYTIPIFGLMLPLIFNLAQRLYDTKLVIVSEEGIDYRKFNDAGQRSLISTKWSEVVKVTIGSSRQSPDHVHVTIETNQGKIRLWAWWTNFEYLAEKVLRHSPSAWIDTHAKEVLKWKASKIEENVSVMVNESRK